MVDVACGSGDAQTLCITDDDNVWSWGDGDYGKLGRGGSDGCKVPMKVDSLAGLGAVKVPHKVLTYVEYRAVSDVFQVHVQVVCGSQFSVYLVLLNANGG